MLPQARQDSACGEEGGHRGRGDRRKGRGGMFVICVQEVRGHVGLCGKGAGGSGGSLPPAWWKALLPPRHMPTNVQEPMFKEVVVVYRSARGRAQAHARKAVELGQGEDNTTRMRNILGIRNIHVKWVHGLTLMHRVRHVYSRAWARFMRSSCGCCPLLMHIVWVLLALSWGDSVQHPLSRVVPAFDLSFS